MEVVNDKNCSWINNLSPRNNIKEIKNNFKYLKLKSANIEKNKSVYVFWYDIDEKKSENFLHNVKKICDENLEISIYSKSGAYE